MEKYVDCRYAVWKKTKSGRLSSTGDGNCTKILHLPKLPNAFFYLIDTRIEGGFINRKKEYTEACIYFSRRYFCGR